MVSDELVAAYAKNLKAYNDMRLRAGFPEGHAEKMRKTLGTMQIQMGELNEQVRRLLAWPRCLG